LKQVSLFYPVQFRKGQDAGPSNWVLYRRRRENQQRNPGRCGIPDVRKKTSVNNDGVWPARLMSIPGTNETRSWIATEGQGVRPATTSDSTPPVGHSKGQKNIVASGQDNSVPAGIGRGTAGLYHLSMVMQRAFLQGNSATRGIKGGRNKPRSFAFSVGERRKLRRHRHQGGRCLAIWRRGELLPEPWIRRTRTRILSRSLEKSSTKNPRPHHPHDPMEAHLHRFNMWVGKGVEKGRYDRSNAVDRQKT